MADKITNMLIVWGAVIFAYIVLAVTMPVHQEMVATSRADMAASANLSNMPGIDAAVASSPVWLWFIPGLVGLVVTAIMLRSSLLPSRSS
ncbi:hypothetical protein ACFLXT_02710 [Chloroflexota bacterium]